MTTTLEDMFGINDWFPKLSPTNHYLQLYHHTLSLPLHPALRLQAQTLEPQSHLQQLFSRFSVVLIGHTGVQGVQRLYLSCPIFVSDFSDKYRSCGEIEA